MDILIYIISLVISMIIVIVIGMHFVKPIIVLDNKKIVYVILIALGFAWGTMVDIFEFPVLYGSAFGMLAGMIHLMVDYKKE